MVRREREREHTPTQRAEDVFLHVLANAGQVNLRFDAYLGEYFRVTDARKLENLPTHVIQACAADDAGIFT